MKLLVILISMLLVSCGGSSSGGGDTNPDPIVCGDNKASCLPDNFQIRKASSLRFIDEQQAIDLIKSAEAKLSDIKVGQNFLKIDKCVVKMANVAQEMVLREYTVVSFDEDTREIKSHVKILSTPKTDYCFGSQDLDTKEYVAVTYLPEESDISNMLDFSIYKRGIIDGNPAVIGTRSDIEDGFQTNLEYGLNLNMPYIMASYLEVVSKGSMAEATIQMFYKYQGVVDASGIDTTNLDEVWE